MNARRGSRQRALGALVIGLSSACASAVENPSAYESERFLCDPSGRSELEERLSRCREAFERDQSCAGVASFQGILEGQPVTVDSDLGRAAFIDFQTLDGRTLRDEVTLDGASPYFRFRLAWKDIGGELTGAAEGTTRSIAPNVGVIDPIELLSDDLTRGSLRITVGGDSVDFTAASGNVDVEVQAASEQAASFHFVFGSDEITGCFHALPTDHRFVREEEPVSAP